MSWIAAGVASAAATAKVVQGYQKGKAAKDLANKEQAMLDAQRNYISPGLLQALSNSEKRKDATMYAGQDIDQANIDRNANQAFNNVSRATTSPTNLVNAAMGIQGQKNIAQQGIQRNLAQYKDRANQDFTSLLLQKANAQTQQKRYNDQIQGAIWQNQGIAKNALWNGITEGMGAGTQAFSNMGGFSKMGGGGGGGGNNSGGGNGSGMYDYSGNYRPDYSMFGSSNNEMNT